MFQWSVKKSRKSPKDVVYPVRKALSLKPSLHHELTIFQVNEREIVEYYEKNVYWTVDFRSDFARIARILTGNAIGLALGGGGAR